MEAEVDKLELMLLLIFFVGWVWKLGRRELAAKKFQKADSDLDYIQYRLEYEIKTNYPDSAGKKNPVTLLKELSAIKSRYQTLHVRFKPIAVEQKETKSRICATFNKTMTLIQELQKETDLELLPLTEEEKTAAEQLRAYMSDL
ncbi:spindle and kinetochore-associated protein 2 isoform X2 [Bubalus kerabau]|uniref:spindle and kinetochore-associated protein 2 isoform X2 n=1 Tax=Bubalus carabanensis TaxID=3119969 RepID=UPI00244E64A0|nr:spindle and kinetochore-associated protein 2 isoform X2 [Bubalus carabanensis]